MTTEISRQNQQYFIANFKNYQSAEDELNSNEQKFS